MNPALNGFHGQVIDSSDAVVDSRIRGAFVPGLEIDTFEGERKGGREIEGVVEAGAPVAEIGADDEDASWVCEIGG